MTPEQVSGFFDAGESFIEGTIAAALVVLWVLTVAMVAVAALTLASVAVYLREWVRHMGATP